MKIDTATPDDIPELLTLVNSAFRGEPSRKGWTTEADLLEGPARTDAGSLREMLDAPGATMLKYCSESGRIEACVYLRKRSHGLYLGMLTVAPELQGAGIGKKLLAAAEDFARQHRCPLIYMRVFSARHELLAWYERHGYRPTGKTEPFVADPKYGVPTQNLEFLILEKTIAPR